MASFGKSVFFFVATPLEQYGCQIQNNFPKHSFRVEHAESLKRFHLDVDVAQKLSSLPPTKNGRTHPESNSELKPLKIDGWKMTFPFGIWMAYFLDGP